MQVHVCLFIWIAPMAIFNNIVSMVGAAFVVRVINVIK